MTFEASRPSWAGESAGSSLGGLIGAGWGFKRVENVLLAGTVENVLLAGKVPSRAISPNARLVKFCQAHCICLYITIYQQVRIQLLITIPIILPSLVKKNKIGSPCSSFLLRCRIFPRIHQKVLNKYTTDTKTY